MTAGQQRAGLDRDVVVNAAIALIDRNGLDTFSMRKLSADLGVDPMAAYYYVPNKAALFDLIVEAVWSEVDIAAPSTGPSNSDWRDVLLPLMRSFRQVLLRHPKLVSLVATRPVVTPRMLSLLDSTIGRLVASGLKADSAAMVLDCVVAYAVGKVLGEIRRPVGGSDSTAPDPHELYANLGIQEHPNLADAMKNGYGWRPDDEFELGLNALLRGWEFDQSGE